MLDKIEWVVVSNRHLFFEVLKLMFSLNGCEMYFVFKNSEKKGNGLEINYVMSVTKSEY